MEELILKSISADIQFENDNLQNKLINFEQRVLEQKNSILHFIVALYEFKNTFCSTKSEWQIQKTKQGKGFFFNDFMEKNFGLSKTFIWNCCKVVDRFTNYSECSGAGTSIQFGIDLQGYSLSKMFELLSLTDTEIKNATKKGLLSPSMSFKDIRKYIKSLKGTEDKKAEQVESESVVEQSVEDFNKEVDAVISEVNQVIKMKLVDIDEEIVKDLSYYVMLEIIKLKK